MKLTKAEFKVAVIAVVFGVIISQVINIFVLPQPKQIATVQLRDIVNNFVTDLAKQNLPLKENKQRIKSFQENLEKKLNSIATKYNIILLSKSAVITDVPDITPVLKMGITNDK